MMSAEMIQAAGGAGSGVAGAPAPVKARSARKAAKTARKAEKATRKAGKQRQWFGPTFLTLLFIGALIIGGVLALSRVLGSVGLTTGDPLAVAGATSADPQGDGEEREDRASSAVDADERTSWVTETYRSAGFSNLKEGVGLAVMFQGRQRIDEVTIQTRTQDWSAEFYMLDDTPPSSGWSDPSEVGTKIGEVSNASGDTTVNLDSSTGGGVLIWVVEHGTTVDNDGGVRNRMQVIEATFR